jgi:hypothetical protein
MLSPPSPSVRRVGLDSVAGKVGCIANPVSVPDPIEDRGDTQRAWLDATGRGGA